MIGHGGGSEERMIPRSLVWAAGGDIIDTETLRGGVAQGKVMAF